MTDSRRSPTPDASWMAVDATRRDFLVRTAQGLGAVLLVPSVVTACRDGQSPATGGQTRNVASGASGSTGVGGNPPPSPSAPTGPLPVEPAARPLAGAGADEHGDFPPTMPTPADVAALRVPPPNWDAMAFNRGRAKAGAVPESYLGDIMGPDGDKQHLGKHLPFVPAAVISAIPPGFIPIMFGDPAKGHAPHPNAPKGPKYPRGHWYDWIRVRKATPGESEEVQSTFTAWPLMGEGDTGVVSGAKSTDPTENDGKNTVYLCRLPPDAKPGDMLRVYAHCLTHGQYVDFVVWPKAG